jgi:hypothetical protein
VWGFIVAGHHARLAPLFIHLGLLLAGIALLIRLLLLLLVPLLARLLLTTAALLLIALIGHQVAPRFKGKRSHRSDDNAMADRRFPTLSMGDWELRHRRAFKIAAGA